MQAQSLALISGLESGVAASCGTGHRCGSDLVLPAWATAAALIQPRAWKLPHATGAAIKRKTNKKLKKNREFECKQRHIQAFT